MTPQAQKNSQNDCEIQQCVFQFLEFLDIHFPSINAEATMTLRCFFRELAISTASVAMRIFGSFFFFHFRASHPVPQNFLSSRIASPESKRKMLFCPNFFPACLQIFRTSPTRGACTSYPESLAVMRDFDRSAQSCKSDISTLLSPSDNVMNYLFFSQFSSSFSSDMIKKTLTSC